MAPLRRVGWIALVVSLVAGGALVAGCTGDTGTSTVAGGQVSPTGQVCPERAATLGALGCAFTTSYGSPTQSSAATRVYALQIVSGHLQVKLTSDGAAGRANSIDVEPNSGAPAFNATTRSALQTSFAPSDAHFSRTYTTAQGAAEQVYTSAQLATRLHSGDFTNHDTHASVAAGTFSVAATPAGGLSLVAGM